MDKRENRQLFLNIKATLDGCTEFSNVEISPDDKYYSVSCDFCNGNKLAFGINKSEGIAFAKASVKTGNMDDSETVELCDRICHDYTQITYSINGNKVIFQIIMPVQKNTFEENDFMVFHELEIFVEVITECCNAIGTGGIIYLQKKQYVKKDRVMHITPDSNIEYEDAVRKQMEDNISADSGMDDSGSNKESVNTTDTDNITEEYESMQTTVRVDDFDMEPTEEGIFGSIGQIKVEDIEESTGRESIKFSGKMPTGFMDDDYGNNKTDYDDGETGNNETEEDMGGIVKSDDIPDLDQYTQKAETEKKTERKRYIKEPENDTGYPVAGQESKENQLKKADVNRESPKPTQPRTSENPKRQHGQINRVDGIQGNKTSYVQETKRNIAEKPARIKEKPHSDERNKKMDNRVSIFVRYEMDLVNITNKYSSIIRKMELDELLSIIESRHAECADTNGKPVNVDEHTKDLLCGMAKEELKKRMSGN